MTDRFSAVVQDLDPFETLSEGRFDDIVRSHGFDPEDEELTLYVPTYGVCDYCDAVLWTDNGDG